jgi:uncharacterized coiled-coil protein SlyX
MATRSASSGRVSKDISPAELSQRVAVIKRFKELLKAQRDRFQAYLNALDKQKDVIETGSTDDLLRHVELEEKIVQDIFSIQKVIDPLENLYQSLRTETSTGVSRKGALPPERTASDEEEIFSLKEALAGLKTEATVRAEQNRDLLAKRMAELRSEIKNLKKNAYASRRFDNNPPPSYIDLKG